MSQAIGTSYSFISNNLRCGTVDSVLIPMPQRDQILYSKVLAPLEAVRESSRSHLNLVDHGVEWSAKDNLRGPSERRLRSASTLNRLRNSLSSDAVKLEFMSTMDQNTLSEDPFSSRDSSPSSSSSVPLSPTTSANVPLLQKSRSKSVQRFANARPTERTDQKIGTKKQKRNKVIKTRSSLDYFTCGSVLKPAPSPTNTLSHTARRVWTALEKKFSQNSNHGTRLIQSNSESGLDKNNEQQKLDDYEFCITKKKTGDTCFLSLVAREKLGVTGVEKLELDKHNDPIVSYSTGLVTHTQACTSRSLSHSRSLNFPGEYSYPWQAGVKHYPACDSSSKLHVFHNDTDERSPGMTCDKCHCRHLVKKVDSSAEDSALLKVAGTNASIDLVESQLNCNNLRTATCAQSHAQCPPAWRQVAHYHIPTYALHALAQQRPIPEIRDVVLTRPQGMQRFGMRIDSIGQGVYLTTVLKNSPAAAAGLKVGDELLQINSFPVTRLSTHTIMELIRSTPQNLHITYRPRVLLVRCQEFQMKKIDGRVGIRLKRLPEGLFVDVVLPYSAACQAGIKEGDELLRVNNQPVNGWSQDIVTQMLREIPPEQTLRLYMKQHFPVQELINTTGSKDVPKFSEHCSSHQTTLPAKSISTLNQKFTQDHFTHEYEQIIPVINRDNWQTDWGQHSHSIGGTFLQEPREQNEQCRKTAVRRPPIDPLGDQYNADENTSYNGTNNLNGSTDDHSTATHSPFRMINSLSDWTIGHKTTHSSGDI